MSDEFHVICDEAYSWFTIYPGRWLGRVGFRIRCKVIPEDGSLFLEINREP